MNDKIELNFKRPGKELGGGTYGYISWYRISDTLHKEGVLKENEVLTGVKIDQNGISMLIESKAK